MLICMEERVLKRAIEWNSYFAKISSVSHQQVFAITVAKPDASRRWNTFKSCEGILDALDADIICFQGKSLSVFNMTHLSSRDRDEVFPPNAPARRCIT